MSQDLLRVIKVGTYINCSFITIPVVIQTLVIQQNVSQLLLVTVCKRVCVVANATLFYREDFTDDSIAFTRSFKCNTEEDYDFKSKNSNSSATLTMTVLQLQAFKFSGNKNDSFFGSGKFMVRMLHRRCPVNLRVSSVVFLHF